MSCHGKGRWFSSIQKRRRSASNMSKIFLKAFIGDDEYRD